MYALEGNTVNTGHLPDVLELLFSDLAVVVDEDLVEGDSDQRVLVGIGNLDVCIGGIVAEEEVRVEHGILQE